MAATPAVYLLDLYDFSAEQGTRRLIDRQSKLSDECRLNVLPGTIQCFSATLNCPFWSTKTHTKQASGKQTNKPWEDDSWGCLSLIYIFTLAGFSCHISTFTSTWKEKKFKLLQDTPLGKRIRQFKAEERWQLRRLTTQHAHFAFSCLLPNALFSTFLSAAAWRRFPSSSSASCTWLCPSPRKLSPKFKVASLWRIVCPFYF